MKKILYLISIALLGLSVSCAKNEAGVDKSGKTIDVKIVPVLTKTNINFNGHSSWSSSDNLAVGYVPRFMDNWIDSGKKFTIALDGQKASFSGTINAPSFEGKYMLYAIHPFKSGIVWNSLTSVTTSISPSQALLNGSLDSNSDILISKGEEVEISKSTTSLSDVEMSFARVNSIARVHTASLVRTDVNASDIVTSVKISTDANVNLAGDFTVDLTNPENVAISDGSKEISVSVSDATMLDLDANISLAPVTIPSGNKLTIEIATLDYTLTKAVTLTSDLVFGQNDIKQLACVIDNNWVKKGEAGTFEGSGTQADPYLIKTYKDMLRLSSFSNGANYAAYTDKYYKLTADIDMSSVKYFTPISSAAGSHTFKGVFDGNGHNIYNFKINSGEVLNGIFAYIGYKDIITDGVITSRGATGTVKDLKLGTLDGSTYDGVSKFTFSSEYSGGWSMVSVLCAAAYNANVSNVVNYIPLEVSDDSNAYIMMGTFAGQLLYRTVYENCINYADVTDNDQEATFLENLVGGMFGTVYESTVEGVQIKNCTNYGTVTCTSPSGTCVAGLLANVKSGKLLSMTGCKNYGNIKAVATSRLSSESDIYCRVAGIAGYYNGMAGCQIIDCENFADITECTFVGLRYVGGIVGGSNKNSLIKNCKNHGNLAINVPEAVCRIEMGGIAGMCNVGTVVDGCMNEGSIRGCRNSNNILGGISGLIASNTTVKNCTNKGTVTHDMTGITGNTGWQAVGGIVGFADGSAACTVTGNTNEATATVSSTTISSSTNIGYGGIVGIIKPAGTYSDNTNLAAVNVNNSGSGAICGGGIVGVDYSTAITAATGNVNKGNVSVSGTDSATAAAGGIIGSNTISTVATGNKSFGAVTSNGQIGAVAGINTGTIANSVVSGSVGGITLTSANYNDYLCSSNSGIITASYGTN